MKSNKVIIETKEAKDIIYLNDEEILVIEYDGAKITFYPKCKIYDLDYDALEIIKVYLVGISCKYDYQFSVNEMIYYLSLGVKVEHTIMQA